jgi:ribonucleoside-diphosphate reductase alpha chain
MVKDRNGELKPIDITKIQAKTANATKGIPGVDQFELESALEIQFYSGISTEEIQNAIVQTAIDKIDVDAPNWTFVAARAFMSSHYHTVGRVIGAPKGKAYSHTLEEYLEYGVSQGRINKSFFRIFDLEELNNYIKPDRDLLFTYLGIKAVYDRYLLKNKNGEVFELPQHMFMAIAMFLAQKEENPMEWAKKFYDEISTFRVMLATPTLSNARTNRNQLSSCFQGATNDNIEAIFDSYKDMSLLSKFGGGIGWDWAQVRASNSNIDDHKGVAGGLIPWLKITNDVALAVDQLGTRKGAIAVYVEPWHMDINDFLDLKKNSGEERRRAHDLFPGLWIPNLFMERAAADEKWTLFDPYETPDLHELNGEAFKAKYLEYEARDDIKKEVISAKKLWQKIILSYFESGSPFLAFKDEANRRNQNPHLGIIGATNLCTEIFQVSSPNKYAVHVEFTDGTEVLIDEEADIEIKLSDDTKSVKKAKKLSNIDVIEHDGEWKEVFFVNKVITEMGETLVCNLASVNLSKVNTEEDMAISVPTAIRMLDNVIDLNLYPIKQAQLNNMKNRAIGLGVMGEAQMVAESGATWGSQDHLEKIDEIMEMFAYFAIDSSSDLAAEKGQYPSFEGSNWSKGILPIDTINEEAKKLTSCNYKMEWEVLRSKVKKQGMRNGYLMAIAPTSTISIVTGTTPAIEPVYRRKFFEENLSGLIPVTAPNISAENWAHYIPAYDLDQRLIIKAAGVRQKWLDQGQSVNVFMRLDKASGRELNDIYMLAWKLGVKSTYYLRSESPEAKEEEVNDRSFECQGGCQ